MSDIHALETNLDLKQNLNVYANCKQLDTLHLIFNIFDDGVQADLSNYNVRLKAMKADNIPLIQETEYAVVNNVVTIIAHEQLTTTSGVTKIELQFINKTTGEKKATFNLNLKVIACTLEVERSISIATYTLLEELENKLDKAVDIAENIDEAIEINKTLSTAITDATNTKNALEIETEKGNVLKTELTKNITDGNIINTTLENSITTGNQLKTDIDIKNIQAESNIKTMESFEDVTKLTQIVASHTTQLSELAKDNARTTTAKDVTGAINELNSIKANKDGTLQSNLNAEMLGGKKVDNLTEYYNMLSKGIFQNPNYLKGYTGSFKTDGTAWGTPNDGAEQYYQITYIPNGVTKNGYGTQVLNCYFGANVGRTFQRFSNGTTWGEWNGLLKTYNRQGVSTDMNNVVEPGVYHIQLEYLTANFPIKQWATVYVSYIAHTRWVQQFWIGQTGETFIRYSYDGGSTTIWTPWKRIATTESMDLALLNGWVSYAQGYDSPRAIKTGNLVALSGLVKSGSGAIAQLPAGWRPPSNIVGTSTSVDVIARIDVWSDGTISPTKANNGWVSLNGISFYVS